MGKLRRDGFLIFLFMMLGTSQLLQAQCVMEPGFSFLTSSRGCAPFTVQIQTEYYGSTPGTVFYVDWGDGTGEEKYTQTGSDGVILQHTYPNSPIECGYDVIIDASNPCNPRGSVTPVETQVMVWTNDIISINPQTFRVCQGFAAELQFADDSDWNCFPHDTRENNVARWIQWIYGTGNAANRISGVEIDNSTPGSFPFNDPNWLNNPIYPVLAPGQTSLPIQVPVTAAGDVGKEFEITLRNWNQCNPYDEDTEDGNPRDPVSGDLLNGDNDPMTTTGRIVIVPSPEPEFQTKAGNASGAVKTSFCIDDQIYFENLTPTIPGANFAYEWEFYDNNSGSGSPQNTSTNDNPTYSFSDPGEKLVRLIVRDQNAVGNCETIIQHTIFISPLLQAEIGVTDLDDNTIVPEFCQLNDESTVFDVRFHDESFGTVTPDIRWRWEFYDQNNNLIREEPAGGGFSSSSIGPFDMQYQFEGEYLVRFIVLDDVTGCSSSDEEYVTINLNPIAGFSATEACFGQETTFSDSATTNGTATIVSWEYDLDNDQVIDTSFTTSTNWNYLFSSPGDYHVTQITTTDAGCSDSVTQVVSVWPIPEAEFSADNTTGCSELVVNFTNESWGQALSIDYYQWWIDSGSGFVLDSTQSPADPDVTGTIEKIFANDGSTDKDYRIYLLANSMNGCQKISDTLTITVTPGASSGFLYTNYSPFNNNCSPQEISFAVDQSTQELSPDDYTWIVSTSEGEIHQESTGTTPEFSHLFENETNSVKQFEITLQTSLSSACTSDSTLTVNINPTPSSEFAIDTVLNTCEEMEIRVSAIQKGLSEYNWSMTAEGIPILSLQGSEDGFSYLFEKSNENININISLTTENLANCSGEPYDDNLVIPQQNNFNAAFEVSSTELSLPDATIEINDTSTPGSWSYIWDFGDGTTSTDPDLSNHTYTEPGTYLIQLKISDGVCETTYSELIEVTSPPTEAHFDFTPDLGCLPLKVTFTNLSDFAESYLWEFGDGETSTLESPTHTYTKAGNYSVTLTAYRDDDEDITYREGIINVHERPVAFFEVRPELVYLPDQAVHTNNLSEGALSYLWDFGDGTVSNEFEPTHYYEAPGQFDITLKAYNEYCHDSLTLRGAVTAKESGRVLLPNAFTPSRTGSGNAGSGENDVFLPLLANVTEFKLQIFNRWGELLFEGFNKGWDGYYNGELCPQDVYVYKLEVIFNTGDQTTKVGDVNLIR